MRRKFNRYDQFAFVAKVWMGEKWESKGNGSKENKRQIMPREILHDSGYIRVYRRKVKEVL